MSQTVLPEQSTITSRAHEIGAQTLYDKCMALAQQPLVELASGGHQPVSRPRSDPLAAAGSQSDRPAERIHARAAGAAGRRDGALQPHQSRLSPAEGVHGAKQTWAADHTPVCWARSRSPISPPNSASTSRCRSTRAAWASCRATTSRVPVAWACRWWPSACSTTRATSSSIWTTDGYQQEEYLDTKVENLPMEPALDQDGEPITISIDTRKRPAAGQGLADARRPRPACTCSTATSKATARRIAS